MTSLRGRLCGVRRTLAVPLTSLILAGLSGCGLPLTPATAPLAVGTWGVVVATVIEEGRRLPPVVLHAQAGPLLTLEGMSGGQLGIEPARHARDWLAQRGLDVGQIERGEVRLARIGWIGADAGSRQPAFVPVLVGTLEVQSGSLIALRIPQAGPITVTSVLAADPFVAGCVDRPLWSDDPAEERLVGRALGAAGMRAVFACEPLHDAGWQRLRLFWHREERRRTLGDPEPDPAPVAGSGADAGWLRVFVWASRSIPGLKLPVFIDGQALEPLSGPGCHRIALSPGRHRVATGSGGFWGLPRRFVDVDVQAGRGRTVEFVIDDAVNNDIFLGFSDYAQYLERAFRLVERPSSVRVPDCVKGPLIDRRDLPAMPS